MKKRLALILVIIFAGSFFAYRQTAKSEENNSLPPTSQNPAEIKPQSFKAVAFGVSEKVSDFAPASPADAGTSGKMGRAEEQARSVANKEVYRKFKADAAHDADAAIAKTSAAAMPAPILSFDGLSNADNAAAYGFRVVPPDANGDVGPNHYVQSVNVLTRVFDKNGAPLTAPFKLSSIFSTLGTTCSKRNDGDSIVLYDALADRWMFSQFCNNFPPFRQLVAVSKTPDPTQDFYVYEFVMPNIKFNDYPKLGVWTNGYYMSTDEFVGGDYAGSGAFAFDRKKMLVGDPNAGYIYFDLATPSTARFGNFLPSDLDGIAAPPLSAPNVFVGYQATEYGDPNDALRLFDFHADFGNPSRSTFTERSESPLAVAAFDPTSPDGRDDIRQPAPGEPLDAQSDRLMYRAAYRNFGARGESIVVNQTVRASPLGQTYRGGVRVYELRKINDTFGIREQATVGTADTSRWMGSAAQDHQGNLAVGYSRSSETEKPAIAYAGKLASEPPGVFRAETALIKGTGVQTGFGARWGDYSQMSVDPTDDCTFWLTNEYYSSESQAESQFGWLTRVGKFKFAECERAPRATIRGVVTNAADNQPIIYDAIVTANQVYSRSANSATGSYVDLTLLPGTYVLTAAARGFRSQTVTVTVADGQTLTENFALQPTALIETANVNITSESCAVNNAVEPSEIVAVNVGFTNVGEARTTDLTATLLPTGGVTNPSPPQSYGTVGDSQVLRPFTFTADPTLDCGDLITLTFQLQDGAENLGTVTAELFAGKPRVALVETFGATGEPNLPAGWTTSASGAQDAWKTTRTQHQTPPLAAFSATSPQIGINEMVSPVIRINSETAEISFRNRYDFETTFLRNRLYDGAVLEIKIGDAAFQDIVQAGGTFTSGGYDGVIESCCQNPLAGKRAWSGKSGPNETAQFITSTVKLPAHAAGKNIRLRWRVGTDNGTAREGQYIDDVTVSDGFECSCQTVETNRAPFDFDGDGRTDLSVFRQTPRPEMPDFYVQNSSNGSLISTAWGDGNDVPVNADYDGDKRADYAIFRPASRTWFVLRSSDGAVFPVVFGAADDKLVPADYDGDGKADIAVYRSSSNSVWYVRRSSDGQMRSINFGAREDLPVAADYDGDGRTDIAVYRPSNGTWYILRSSDNELSAVRFGQNEDRPVSGDYDADGKADFVVYRPSNGVWYQQKTREGFAAVRFGAGDDQLLQADFDADGKRDIAVYRPIAGVWYYLKSSDGAFVARQFGVKLLDIPLPTIFVP